MPGCDHVPHGYLLLPISDTTDARDGQLSTWSPPVRLWLVLQHAADIDSAWSFCRESVDCHGVGPEII